MRGKFFGRGLAPTPNLVWGLDLFIGYAKLVSVLLTIRRKSARKSISTKI